MISLCQMTYLVRDPVTEVVFFNTDRALFSDIKDIKGFTCWRNLGTRHGVASFEQGMKADRTL